MENGRLKQQNIIKREEEFVKKLFLFKVLIEKKNRLLQNCEYRYQIIYFLI